VHAPLNYLTGAGERASPVVPLTWFLIWASVISIVVVTVLLVAALARARPRHQWPAIEVRRAGRGLPWIWWGLGVPAVPLLITLVWTMTALARVAGPPASPALTLDVTPHQWWWEVEYDGATPAERFAVANEIHVPAGRPVLVRLHGGDVIHSFWVPQLAGKTDAIPGVTNLTWLEARRPGIYRGQCGEYCGAEHARMGFEVVAETPERFEAWRRAQLTDAPAPAGQAAAKGLSIVEFRCGLCHAVRGTLAGSHVGPDLTHLMSRRTIAALRLPNTPGALAGWVQAPQSVKPGARMPDQHLSAEEMNDVLAYLETLR
jgi:cytochrome c oxidase subunit 2